MVSHQSPESHGTDRQGIQPQLVAAGNIYQQHDQSETDHIAEDIDKSGDMEFLIRLDQALERYVHYTDTCNDRRYLIHEHGIRHLPLRNLQPVEHIIKPQSLCQDQNDSGHENMQHQTDVEYPLRISVRLSLLDVYIAAGRSAHRGSKETQQGDDPGDDAVKTIVGDAQSYEQKSRRQKAYDHDADHPDIEYQGVSRNSGIFLMVTFHTIQYRDPVSSYNV